ncbi:hypothetical protein TNCV_4293631 [Trichonephila clavipes]|uniref:Uncharacterized protein n=1 Tax=Trichonephila clavipes TaxID=2585209 RepID=A0A8X6V062_TRICX|nr:hypothetical protein TNCV_4293631 [Trichonephila clavipes]
MTRAPRDCDTRTHLKKVKGRPLKDLVNVTPPKPNNVKGLKSLMVCGRSILVVKMTDSWLACHELEPCTTEDPPNREGQCTLNVSRFKRPPVGVV